MDTKTLLKSLKENKVNFVIIGGTACIAHGHARLTKDIDIFVEPNRKNMQRAFTALEACGYDLMDTTVEEALQKKLLFRQYILLTDLHSSVTGVSFEDVWRNKVQLKFEGEDVYFSSLEDLIKMKSAAGRPQDLEDLKALMEIQKQTRKKSFV